MINTLGHLQYSQTSMIQDNDVLLTEPFSFYLIALKSCNFVTEQRIICPRDEQCKWMNVTFYANKIKVTFAVI